MTLYEFCKNEADIHRSCAKRAPTNRMKDHFLLSAEMWKARAGRLSVEDGSRDIKDVDLTKIFDVKASVSEKVVATDPDDDDEN